MSDCEHDPEMFEYDGECMKCSIAQLEAALNSQITDTALAEVKLEEAEAGNAKLQAKIDRLVESTYGEAQSVVPLSKYQQLEAENAKLREEAQAVVAALERAPIRSAYCVERAIIALEALLEGKQDGN